MTDEDVKELARLARLEELALDECPGIRIGGVRELVGHPSLKSLRLAGTGITAEQVKELKTVLPGVQIR